MAVDQMEKAHVSPKMEVHVSPSLNGPEWKSGVDRSEGGYLRSRVLKRSVLVGRHRTSVSLEDVFWNELRAIAKKSNLHLSQLISQIDAEREHCNLSSAIRMFVFQNRAFEPETHRSKDNKQM
jgi:predicted DNA-binding ribbon-helix-helix protein